MSNIAVDGFETNVSYVVTRGFGNFGGNITQQVKVTNSGNILYMLFQGASADVINPKKINPNIYISPYFYGMGGNFS